MTTLPFDDDGYEPFEDDDCFLPITHDREPRITGAYRSPMVDGLVIFGGVFLVAAALTALTVWWRA